MTVSAMGVLSSIVELESDDSSGYVLTGDGVTDRVPYRVKFELCVAAS